MSYQDLFRPLPAAPEPPASGPSAMEPRGETLPFETGYRVRRALHGRHLFRRPDLRYWGAVITGRDQKYGLAREFLPRVWPAVRDRRAQYALDFSAVRPGAILQLRGMDSGSRLAEEFWRVLEIDDEGVRFERLRESQVAQLFQKP